MLDLDALDFQKGGGFVTVVAQHAGTGQVLMVAFATRDALQRTLDTGELHYHSRTRGLWHKGATSGHTQRVVTLLADCDGDAVLARVIPAGPACHTGMVTCFGNDAAETVGELDSLVAQRQAAPPAGRQSYTAKLFADRNLRLKKIGEEASEFVTACADSDVTQATAEAADLLYHMLVALRATGGTFEGVREVLRSRERASDGPGQPAPSGLRPPERS